MSFAAVQTADTKYGTQTSNSNSWTLTYPTNLAAGDLIVALVAHDGSSEIGHSFPSGWGWTEHGSGANTIVMGVKKAAGTESGDFTFGLPASEQGAWRVFRITGCYDGSIGTGSLGYPYNCNMLAFESAETGSPSANPNPPSLNPSNWDVEDTLWVAACSVDTSRTVSGYPSNCADLRTADVSGGSTGATLGIAMANSASASLDPGTFTISVSDDWVCITVAVRPGTTAAALDGDIVCSPSTVTGILTTAIKLAGALAGAAALVASLLVPKPLAGALAGTSSTSGALTASIRLAGGSSGSSSVTGALTAQIKLAGDLAGSSGATGTLSSAAAALEGDLSGNASLTGALTTGIPLAGSTAGSSAATGDLTTVIQLAGALAGSASTTGALTAQIQLAGALSGSASTTGNLTVPGAWELGDTKAISYSTQSDTTVTSPAFAAGVPQGDLIVGIVSWDGVSVHDVTGISDNGTGTANDWQMGDRILQDEGDQYARYIWCVNKRTSGTLTTVTATYDASVTWRAILVRHYSGNNASPFDGSAQLHGYHATGDDLVYSGNITPTTDGDLIVGLAYNYQDLLAAGTNFGNFFSHYSNVDLYIEDLVQATAAQIQATFDAPNSGTYRDHICMVIAFKPAGGAAAALDGDLAGSSSLTGDLSTGIVLDGDLAGSSSLIGALVTGIPLDGALAGSGATTGELNETYPVVHSTNDRYLVTQQGAPWPLKIAAAWSLIVLPEEDFHTYLDDIAAKGFNAAMVNIIDCCDRCDNRAKAANLYYPFLKRLDGADWTGTFSFGDINDEAPDFTTPNPAYWAHIDKLLAYLRWKDMAILLFPSYVGNSFTLSEGWMQIMVANGQTKMEAYGAWIATRYKNQPNIIWMLGGDAGSYTGDYLTAELALLTGLQSVSGQRSTLMTGHWVGNMTALDQTNATLRDAQNLDHGYSWASVPLWTRNAYAESNVMPSFLLEGPYDQEGPDGTNVNPGATQPCRRFAWPAMLGAIGGSSYGNGYVWMFNDGDWDTHLNTQTAQDVARMHAFFGWVPFHKLVPDGLGGIGTLITAGGGAPDTPATYVSAAADPDGMWLVAYRPPGHSGTFTVDRTKLAGTFHARWFNPYDASFTEIGVSPNTGTQEFTAPGDNGSGYTDWVLLLEVDLAGGVSGSASLVGDLTTGAQLAGGTAGSSTVTGALTAQILLAGGTSGSSATTGALTAQILLAGSASGSAAMTGALTAQIQLAGDLAGAASLTGELIGAAALDGDLAGAASLTGDLTTEILLLGSLAGSSTVAGALTTGIPLGGALAGSSATTGALTTEIRLAGAAAGSGSTTGALTTAILLDGGLSGQATLTGDLTLPGQAAELRGGVTGAASLTGALSTEIRLAGGLAGSASATGDLLLPKPLVGSTSGGATVTGALTAQVLFAGGTSGAATLTGALTTEIRLAGGLVGGATAAGDLLVPKPLAGALAGTSSTTGALTTQVGLAGALAGTSSATATLTTQIRLAGALAGAGMVDGDLTAYGKIMAPGATATLVPVVWSATLVPAAYSATMVPDAWSAALVSGAPEGDMG